MTRLLPLLKYGESFPVMKVRVFWDAMSLGEYTPVFGRLMAPSPSTSSGAR